jgi:phytanoyl-CoA hydroxylase
VSEEVPAGTALIFNGYLLHRSLENSGRHGYRRALANHYMSAESLLPWHPPGPGEHMAIADYRDIVMVAGEDPYAWKGTVDIATPGSRPDKDGGCHR